MISVVARIPGPPTHRSDEAVSLTIHTERVLSAPRQMMYTAHISDFHAAVDVYSLTAEKKGILSAANVVPSKLSLMYTACQSDVWPVPT